MTVAIVTGAGLANTNSASTITLPAPASIVAGNLLVAIVYSASSSSSAWGTPPSGWTQRAQSLPSNTAGNVGVWTKTATGSEPANYTFTGNAWLSGVVLQVSGSTGFDGSAAFNTAGGSASTCTAPSVTPSQAGDVLLTGFGSLNGQAFTTPSGMSVAQSVSSAGNSSCCVFSLGLSTTAPTGTVTSTTGAANTYCGWSLLLAAAPTGFTGTGSGAITFAGSGTVAGPTTGTGAISFAGSGTATLGTPIHDTVILTEPFETLPSWASAGSLSAGSRPGGTGANVMNLTGSGVSAVYSIPTGQRSKTTWVDFWWRSTVVNGSTILQLCSPAGTAAFTLKTTALSHLQATVNVFGVGNTVVTGELTITANTWYHLAAMFLEDAHGNARVWVNGAQMTSDFDLNTQAGSSPVVETMVLWGATNTFDDLFLSTDLFSGVGAITFGGSGSATVSAVTGTGAITFGGSGTATVSTAAQVGAITFGARGDAEVTPHVDVYTPPEWSWQLLDPSGTFIEALSAATARKLTFQLDGPASATFTMPGGHPQTAKVVELATDILVSRNGRPLFRGRVGASSETHSASADTVNFTAVDYRGMLKHRLVWPTSTLEFLQVDQSDIAWRLISDSQALPAGSFGITRGIGAVTGFLRDRTYTAGSNLGQMLDELGDVISGYDWEIDAHLAFNVFYPKRGRDAGVLTYGRDIVAATATINPDGYANAVFFTGGMPATFPEEATVTTFPTGIGRWEEQKSDPSVVLQDTVSEYANSELAFASQLTQAFTITLATNRWDPYTLWLGDVIRMIIQAGRLNVDAQRRIVQIDATLSDDGVETVDLAVAPLRSTFSGRIESLDARISALELQPEGLNGLSGGFPGDPWTGFDGFPGGGGGGGFVPYASLRGPGETGSPGGLRQEGDFAVAGTTSVDLGAPSITVHSTGTLQLTDNSTHVFGDTNGIAIHEEGTSPLTISSKDGGIKLSAVGANTPTIDLESASTDSGPNQIIIRSNNSNSGGIVIQAGANAGNIVPTEPGNLRMAAHRSVQLSYGYGWSTAEGTWDVPHLTISSGQTGLAFNTHIWSADHPGSDAFHTALNPIQNGDICFCSAGGDTDAGAGAAYPSLWIAYAGSWHRIWGSPSADG